MDLLQTLLAYPEAAHNALKLNHWLLAPIGLTILMQYADVRSTNLCISVGLRESNILMKKSMDWFGTLWWVPKAVVVVLAVIYLLATTGPYGATAGMVVVCVFYYWVVFQNNMPLYNAALSRRMRGKRKQRK